MFVYTGTDFKELPTAITPRIRATRHTVVAGTGILLSAENTTVTGGKLESDVAGNPDPIVPFNDLHYEWRVTGPATDYVFSDPRTNAPVSMYKGQNTPLCWLWLPTPGDYTVQLTAIARDTAGRTICNSTTTITINQSFVITMPQFTQGNFTITFEGQTTPTLVAGAYGTTPKGSDARAVLAALLGLSAVPDDGLAVNTSSEYGPWQTTWEFEVTGSWAGTTRTLPTVDTASLTNGTHTTLVNLCRVYQKRAPETVTKLTVQAETGVFYVDPVDGNDSNDGATIGAPKRTFAGIKSIAAGGTGRKILIKGGTTMVLPATQTLRGLMGTRIDTYGTGKAEIQYGTILMNLGLNFAAGMTRDQLWPLRDLSFSNIIFRMTSATTDGAIGLGTGTTGSREFPAESIEDLYFKSCEFHGGFAISQEGCSSHGFAMFNCLVRKDAHGIPHSQSFISDVAYVDHVTIGGPGDVTYDHYNYDKIASRQLHLCYKTVPLATCSQSYVWNFNTLDHGHESRWLVVDRSLARGSIHGIDFSAKTNEYIGKYGHFGEVIVQRTWIFPGDLPVNTAKGFGITNSESRIFTLRDVRISPGRNGMAGKAYEGFAILSRFHMIRCLIYQHTDDMNTALINWQSTAGRAFFADNVIVSANAQANRDFINYPSPNGSWPDQVMKRNRFFSARSNPFFGTTFAGAITNGRMDPSNELLTGVPFRTPKNGGLGSVEVFRVGPLELTRRVRKGL
jgi:hypothetical protein